MNSSPIVSVCRSGRQHSGQGNCQHLASKDLEPGGQQGRRSPQSSRAEPLAVMPSEISVVWSLPQLYLESGVLHPSRSLEKCLGTPYGKWEISPGAYLWVVLLCRHGCSGHVCRYLRCVSLPDVYNMT